MCNSVCVNSLHVQQCFLQLLVLSSVPSHTIPPQTTPLLLQPHWLCLLLQLHWLFLLVGSPLLWLVSFSSFYCCVFASSVSQEMTVELVVASFTAATVSLSYCCWLWSLLVQFSQSCPTPQVTQTASSQWPLLPPLHFHMHSLFSPVAAGSCVAVLSSAQKHETNLSYST